MALTKKQRQEVREKSGGKCWYCGCELPERGWQADHFHPVIRIGKEMAYPQLDTIENIVPACGPCNNFKRQFSIDVYRSMVSNQFENVQTYSTGMRQLVRLGLVDMTSKPVEFWFEKQGFEVKPELELLGISKKAKSIIWKHDKSEGGTLYTKFENFICTLRDMGPYYLAIAISYDWKELGRAEFVNGRLLQVQAADWALKLAHDS